MKLHSTMVFLGLVAFSSGKASAQQSHLSGPELGFRSSGGMAATIKVEPQPGDVPEREAAKPSPPTQNLPRTDVVVRRPPDNRFYVGFSLGSRVYMDLEVDGKANTSEDGSHFNGGLKVGYDRRVVDWLSVGVFAGATSWDSWWSSTRGQGRAYFDFDLEPRLRYPLVSKKIAVEGFLGIPFGITSPKVSDVKEYRAVKVENRTTLGANAGVSLGLELWGKTFGGYLDLRYVVHSPTVHQTSTPVAQPELASEQTYSYTDHQILFTFGGAIGF